MPRRPLLLVLGTMLGFALACGKSEPKYSQERVGEVEVVGDGDPAAARRAEGRKKAGTTTTPGRNPSGGTNTTRVDDPVSSGLLPPVYERYEHLVEKGHMTTSDCPDGTEFVDEKGGRSLTQFCILPEDDVRHGPSMTWFGSNRLKAVGPYVAGKRNGWWIQFKKNGKRAGAWRYLDGNPVEGEDAP